MQQQAADQRHAFWQQISLPARFHVQTHHGLGVGRAQIEPPIAEFEAEAVGFIHMARLRFIDRADAGDGGGGILQLEIDLTRGRESQFAARHQLGHRHVAAADEFGDQQPRDHAAIAIDEVAEVVVGRHFATIDRALIAHRLFDKGMAGAGLHRDTARGGHDILGVPDHARVMDDLGPGLFGEENLGQQANDIFAVDEGTGVVEEEAAVEIAVPGDAQIGLGRQYGVSGRRAVFRQQRVGDAVGKAAVGIVMHADELQG